MAKKSKTPLTVEALKHDEATRKNIPTAEYQSLMQKEDSAPVRVSYPRGGNGLDDEKAQRNRDLDPQLVWRGKDQQDWSDLVVNAPPLYIQEKVHPKVLIDDLRRETERREASAAQTQAGNMADLFADFNRRYGQAAGADLTPARIVPKSQAGRLQKITALFDPFFAERATRALISASKGPSYLSKDTIFLRRVDQLQQAVAQLERALLGTAH